MQDLIPGTTPHHALGPKAGAKLLNHPGIPRSSCFNLVFYSLAFPHSLMVRPFSGSLKTKLAWPVKGHVATLGKCVSLRPQGGWGQSGMTPEVRKGRAKAVRDPLSLHSCRNSGGWQRVFC